MTAGDNIIREVFFSRETEKSFSFFLSF